MAHDIDDDRMLRDVLRCPQAPVDLAAIDTGATPKAPGDKETTKDAAAQMGEQLSALQERLFARGRVNADSARRVLVILQGMDTAGKGGVVRHTFGLLDPQGVQLAAFKAPTKEELSHDFLWRIRRELPDAGMIGVFDRSHYEDVLVARVDELVEPEVWRRRYDRINRFEAELAASGTVIVKFFLHISPKVQQERLVARLDDPEKHWKFDPSDIAARAKWGDYQQAYTDVLERCNPDIAPWYVIPADHKWYRNWAVAQILLETLRSMNITWPAVDFDVDEQRHKLLGD
ncbi:PPK2 family polyphosphate kinase [Cutibacterium granulosum]|jgi:polyphosphate:nucleotide phosphotransferase, PPK2 family|uniref:PPK2 family polyphosphate kinase n=1 Tax=Cutibacterium granulosum TaxID=33011 RepID=UPI0003B8C55B|nr:PPK2 family polyphosphate--nucleotide phosphotransferase [Cutibacterium granulosum]ERS33409.1 PPK2 family polyphosphate:nucleotide phosphotransferase [Propionibacterium sp. KPL1844]MDU1580953.1 PPK2 family polyphosphate--nucleotide phosphotransferase [Cutibacterium granulosum]MDU6338886.1 PPK2 family polyphosphate--nucleotide phosphotransferase [Cutibacterium granulosum]MEA5644125.1 PPK2 family polyphosphate--nucleotide phosphotransferase [Cutibacterium granulosum]MEA5647979.1 PPK2 family p